MDLQITPKISMCDEKFTTVITDLKPNSKIRVDASMCFPWAPGAVFKSYAWFTADNDGIVDLLRHKPDSGSYDYIDGMGLIKSLQCTDMKKFMEIGKNIQIDKSVYIDITAQCEETKAHVRLERKFLKESVKRQRITDEFIGELFYSENAGNKTIVLLGGSGSGDLDLLSLYGAPLAAHGFNVLVVAYFGVKGLPPKLSEVPIEYFDKVFAWLSKNPVTKEKPLHLFCISKGAELGLILASRNPAITRVAALAPHAYCFQGLAFKNVSSWTLEGKQLPFIRLRNRWVIADIIHCFLKNKPFGFTHSYIKALKLAKNKESARINVENIHADILLITSKQCNMWNTYDGCIEIMETLRKSNYRYRYDLVTYEDAGEPYAPAYMIPYGDAKIKIAPRLIFTPGGTAKGNAHAQEDSWIKTIEFLKQ